MQESELETGLYGFEEGPPSKSRVAPADYTGTMPARYVRIEKPGDLEFVELEAFDESGENVALARPVSVSSAIWGDGSPGNDGNHADGGVHPLVMMRDPARNWWEVDLGVETALTHVVITMREYRMTGGYRSLNGAMFAILDRQRNTVESCQLEVGAADEQLAIPMDENYFHRREIATRFGIESDSPRNVIAADAGQLRLIVPDSDQLTAGSVTVGDLEGRELQAIQLARGKGEYAIPLPARGHYTVAATVTYDDGLVVSKERSAAVVGELLDSRLRLNSIFGVQGKGPELVQLGAAWSWAQILTHHFSRTASGYDWGPQMALRIRDGKLDLSPEINWVVMFTYLPEYLQSIPHAGRGYAQTSPPNDYDEFRRLIRAATALIPEYARWVAPVPEPSHSFTGDAEALARYHRVAAEAVREVRPDIRVIGPMMSPGNAAALESIAELDEYGLFDDMDGISINPYVVEPFRSRMPEADFIEFVDAVIAHFASTGRPEYPVYLTEFGFGYDADNPRELAQARYSSRAAILLASRSNVRLANFFLLGGDGWGYSYFHADGTPRPVYPAMAQAFRWLAGSEPVAAIRLAPTLHLAAFARGGHAGLAVWDTAGESVLAVPVRLIARIQDMMGRDITAHAGRLTAGKSPVYLSLSDDALLSCLASGQSVEGGRNSAASDRFDDVIMPQALNRDGSAITVAAKAGPGPYRFLGRSQGRWRLVTIGADSE